MLEGHSACVTIEDKHTNIIKIEKDGVVLFEKACKAEADAGAKEQSDKRALLNVADILQFADEVRIEDIKDVIGRQIEMNTAISEEGLRNPYGAEVGRTLLNAYGDDIKIRAKAKAAAGSDARMNGCSMPVVINSGSGNQGMTWLPAGHRVCEGTQSTGGTAVSCTRGEQPGGDSSEVLHWQSFGILRGGQCGVWSRSGDCVVKRRRL